MTVPVAPGSTVVNNHGFSVILSLLGVVTVVSIAILLLLTAGTVDVLFSKCGVIVVSTVVMTVVMLANITNISRIRNVTQQRCFSTKILVYPKLLWNF